MTALQGAETATAMRNHIMELARLRGRPIGRAYATKLKRYGKIFAELSEKYAQSLYKTAFTGLDEVKQAKVYTEMVAASGRPNAIHPSSETALDTHVPVWMALADLFVGKELQDYDFDHIARRLLDAEFPVSRIETILWQEVFPVLGANLGALAIPEMEGWSEPALRSAIKDAVRHPPSAPARLVLRWRRSGNRTIRSRWTRLRRELAGLAEQSRSE